MRIALRDAIGLLIKCPDRGCGARASVEPSRHGAPRVGGIPPPENLANAGTPSQAASTAHLWQIVRCSRTGAKLFPANTMVELHIDG